MRILHCMRTAGIGGIERLVMDLLGAQLKMGYRPALLLGQKDGLLMGELDHEAISVYEVRFNGGYDISPKKIAHAVSVMRESDLLHMHGFSPAIALASIISGVPVVYTFHGLSKGVRTGNALKNWVYEAMKSRYLSKNVDYITANSEFMMRHVEQGYNVEDVPHSVVLNGIGSAAGRRSDAFPDHDVLEACRNKFVVGAVSRFTERKRIDRIIRAFKMIHSEHDSILLLVGDGQTMPEIRDLIQKTGMEDAVVLTGYKSCVEPYYNLMDVCVAPSQGEGFGLVAVEGYQHGKPVIAFEDGGGLVEIITPFEPWDIVLSEQDLVRRIAYYIQNPEAVKRREKERCDYARSFTIEAMAVKLDHIYKGVIKNSVSRSDQTLVMYSDN